MSEGSGLRSLNAAIRGLANRFTAPDNALRRALSPAYSSVLSALTRGRGYPAEINGQVFRIDPRFRWRVTHAHERAVAEYLQRNVKPGQTCFDVGANVGVYVLQLARWCAPHGRVIAFEPNPSTIPVLEKHITMNGPDARVTLVPKGAGAQSGTAALFDDVAGSGLSRIGGPHPAIEAAVTPRTIPVTTIDEYCRETGIVPDWMLIDVEGYEYEVLQGAADTLRRHRPGIVMELHPHVLSEESRAAGERLLRALGLEIVPLAEVEGRQETFVTVVASGVR